MASYFAAALFLAGGCSAAEHRWRPTCTVERGNSNGNAPVCMRHGQPVNCTRNADNKRPTGNGAFALDDEHAYEYLLDRGLAAALGTFFLAEGRKQGAAATVTEFGAGKGCYTDALLDAGVHARGYEGADGIEALTRGFVARADLTTPLHVSRSQWVLCLEVAEHIPKAHEGAFLRNLHDHNTDGVVLSWSSAKAGIGHVNPRDAAYVEGVMRRLGYAEDVAEGGKLRAAVSTFSWFKGTGGHGKVGGGVRVWRRVNDKSG